MDFNKNLSLISILFLSSSINRNVVAIAGKDYAVIASDTRLTSGYQIYTRNQSKLIKV